MKTNTLRLLIISIMSMLVCVVLLVGTTFAWFTGTATSGNNVIRTGSFDVGVYYRETYAGADDAGWTAFEGALIFNDVAFLPGAEAVRYIKFTNSGAVQLKYDVVLPALEATSTLTDALLVYCKTDVDAEITTADMTALNDCTLTELNGTADASSHNAAMFSVTVDPGETAIAAVGFKLPDTYTDEHTEANFRLRVIATQ